MGERDAPPQGTCRPAQKDTSFRPEGRVVPPRRTRRVGRGQYRLKANPIQASRESYIGLTRILYWLEATLIQALSRNIETPSGLGNGGFAFGQKGRKPAPAPASLAGLAEGTAKIQHFSRKCKCHTPSPHIQPLRCESGTGWPWRCASVLTAGRGVALLALAVGAACGECAPFKVKLSGKCQYSRGYSYLCGSNQTKSSA